MAAKKLGLSREDLYKQWPQGDTRGDRKLSTHGADNYLELNFRLT